MRSELERSSSTPTRWKKWLSWAFIDYFEVAYLTYISRAGLVPFVGFIVSAVWVVFIDPDGTGIALAPLAFILAFVMALDMAVTSIRVHFFTGG